MALPSEMRRSSNYNELPDGLGKAFARREPHFRQRGPWYMRTQPHASLSRLDRRTYGQGFRPGQGMPHQCTTAAAMRRWDRYAKATLAAMAALIVLAADTAARELGRAQTR